VINLKWTTNSNTTKYSTKQAATELHTILQDLESSKLFFNILVYWNHINEDYQVVRVEGDSYD